MIFIKLNIFIDFIVFFLNYDMSCANIISYTNSNPLLLCTQILHIDTI